MIKQFQRLFLISMMIFMAGCNSSKTKNKNLATQQKCMENIIALDDSLGTVRNHACKTISLSETIKQYTKAMEKLDDRHCPEAFATAYKNHREAWSGMLKVTDKYPDLRGEMHDLFKEIEAGEDAGAFAPLLQLVWDSWAEVESAMKE